MIEQVIYRDILDRVGYRENSCGFVCGREEMAGCDPPQVCLLRHTNRDVLDTLTEYLPGPRKRLKSTL